MSDRKEIFGRTELLLGKEVVDRLNSSRVILFGVGGVGSWCAEGLIRSGVGHLTIVDSDDVSWSNINRQLPATTITVGQPKVDVLKKRLQEINPDAEICAKQMVYDEETSASFGLNNYDYVIDAIDSLKNKLHLIRVATDSDAVFFSSMGAALKLDPTRVKVAEFWKVAGCPLAAALRRRLRKEGSLSKKFMCVYSDELLDNKGELIKNSKEDDSSGWDMQKARINGSIVQVTAVFGFTLSGLVVQDIVKKVEK
ncbi:tRNA threonylcarbamoyladenosine dehydratase [Dysgonomonas sp. 216]|uniref:tRNA threonylcarbamoyladenosine dehydratase n=1 Tax=Dysgonomonas sp. 216 TaxID=2302934 RepID=UPI0013D7AAFE|nr:tRNA threonylcarbamoyladenosine dehydratase [Dysgonomonas sp. 216]NDW19842.1 tRNA threonylcarbamoyladenosine dehydratase [Dysgonomonas sp. 216]